MAKKKINKSVGWDSFHYKISTSVSYLSNKLSEYWLFYITLLAGAFLLYGWTYTFSWGMDDAFLYDILHNIENNWHGFSTILSQRFGEDYRPVTVITFWLEKLILKDFIPANAHLINVFIFGLLLIQIIRFLIAGKYYEDRNTLMAFAFLVALFFLVHPMHVNVVANIKSRDNLLSMLFGVTGALYFIYYLDTKNWKYLVLFILFLSLAELSKPDAYVFLLFPVIFVIFYKKINIKQILKILFSVWLAYFVVFNIKDVLMSTFVDKSVIGRVYLDSPLVNSDSFINRLSLSLTTMFYYFKFFIIPYGHYAYYGYNQIQLTSLFSPINILSFLIHVLIIIFCVRKFRINKIYLFSFVFYLLAIAYASNFPVIVSGIIADRYNFIGSLGQSMFLAALVVDYFKVKDWKIIFNIWIAVPLIIFTGFAIYKTSAWKDTKTLLLRDIKNNTNSAQTYLMLSSIYLNAALFDNLDKETADENIKIADRYTKKGLFITTENPFLLQNKGIIELHYNKNQSAIIYFNKAYKLDTTLSSNINYIGVAYRNLNKIDSALYFFKSAMNKTNEFSYAANNYIEMLIRNKQYKEVDSTIDVLLKRFPNDKYLKDKAAYLKNTGSWYAY